MDPCSFSSCLHRYQYITVVTATKESASVQVCFSPPRDKCWLLNLVDTISTNTVMFFCLLALIGILLKLHCSYMYLCISVTVFLKKLCFLIYFFVLFFERILFHWQSVFLRPNHLTNSCFSVLIVLIYLVAELLSLFWVVQLWCFMVKKGLRMKCVMLFPKYNIRNKINTHKNLSYIILVL